MGQCQSSGEPSVDGPSFEGNWEFGVTVAFYVCLWLSFAFAFAATAISFFLIYKHLQYYAAPTLQRYIVRILIMVPIYSVDSWLSFLYPQHSIYFALLRDCYEAFVIHNFLQYLLNVLGGIHAASKIFDGKEVTLPFPLNWIRFRTTGHGTFLRRCRGGTAQYVAIRPSMTVLAVWFTLGNRYCPESMSPMYGNFWINMVIFASVSIAMYCLIAFYVAAQQDLKPCDPLWKFISIKFVIFFCFWQGVLVSALMKFDIIRRTTSWTADDLGVGVQSFLICIEMLFAALVHIRAFGYHAFRPENGHRSDIWKSIRHVCSIKDLLVDLYIPLPSLKILPSLSSGIFSPKTLAKQALYNGPPSSFDLDKSPAPTSPSSPAGKFSSLGPTPSSPDSGHIEMAVVAGPAPAPTSPSPKKRGTKGKKKVAEMVEVHIERVHSPSDHVSAPGDPIMGRSSPGPRLPCGPATADCPGPFGAAAAGLDRGQSPRHSAEHPAGPGSDSESEGRARGRAGRIVQSSPDRRKGKSKRAARLDALEIEIERVSPLSPVEDLDLGPRAVPILPPSLSLPQDRVLDQPALQPFPHTDLLDSALHHQPTLPSSIALPDFPSPAALLPLPHTNARTSASSHDLSVERAPLTPAPLGLSAPTTGTFTCPFDCPRPATSSGLDVEPVSTRSEGYNPFEPESDISEQSPLPRPQVLPVSFPRDTPSPLWTSTRRSLDL